MAITLTSDPIIPAADAASLLSWATGDELNLAINSASVRFLKYTGRQRITSGTLVQTEALPPRQVPVLWLRASPVDTGETFAVEIYEDGSSAETLTDSDYDLEDVTGRLVLGSSATATYNASRRVVVSYTGGWTTVPGDVMESALRLMRLDKQRRDGMTGVASASREGMSTSYQTADLPAEISDVWQAYRIY